MIHRNWARGFGLPYQKSVFLIKKNNQKNVWKFRVSTGSVETRWCFLMVYRNNAGRLGAGFISVCLETRWLGHFCGFYVPGWPCTHIHACIHTKAHISGDLWVLLVQKSLNPQPSTNYSTRLFSNKIFVTYSVFILFLFMRPSVHWKFAIGVRPLIIIRDTQ